MRRDAIKVGAVYAVKVHAEDVPVAEDPEIIDEGLEDNWLFSRRHAVKGRLIGYSDYSGEVLPYPETNKAGLTKGRALGVEVMPGGTFVALEVEWRVARRCPTCHLGLVLDENDEVIYDAGPFTVVVPPRRVLNTWEGWQAEVAVRQFENDAWIRHQPHRGSATDEQAPRGNPGPAAQGRDRRLPGPGLRPGWRADPQDVRP